MPGRKVPPSDPSSPNASSLNVPPPRARRRIQNLWHTPAVILLEATAPYSHELIQEVHLRRQPQRIDLLILQRRQAGAEEITHLEALYTRLGDVNLIELKGGTDQVERLDVHTLLGYASQLRVSIDRPLRKTGHAPPKPPPRSHFLDIAPGAEIRLIVLAPTLHPEFLQEVQRLDGRLNEVSSGIWEGKLAGYALIFLETEVVWKTTLSNRLFYILTRGVIEGPERLGELTEREEGVYNEIMDWLLQLPPLALGDPTMRLEKIKEYQARQLERKQAWLNSLSPEERLRGLRPEDRLQGLRPEDRLRGLPPGQLVQALTRDGVVQSLSEQEREALARLLAEGR